MVGLMRLTEAFEAYRLDVIQMKNQSSRTEEAHLTVQKSLVRFFGDCPIENITFPMVREWKLDLDKTRAAGTVRFYVIRLRVVLGYVKLRGETCLDPELIPVPKRPDTVPSVISKETVQQLIDCQGGPRSNPIHVMRNKALISLLYASGVRVSELCALNRDSIRDKKFTLVGKGGKARLCFIDERTERLLSEYIDKRTDNYPHLFSGKYEAHRITPGNVQEIFRYACKKSGIDGVHPHTLRHSFATDLIQNNTNLFYVQQMMGHASLQTTQAYLHVSNPDLESVYRKHHTI